MLMFISEARSVSIRGCLGHSVGRGFKVNPEDLTESSVTPPPPVKSSDCIRFSLSLLLCLS